MTCPKRLGDHPSGLRCTEDGPHETHVYVHMPGGPDRHERHPGEDES